MARAIIRATSGKRARNPMAMACLFVIACTFVSCQLLAAGCRDQS
jgi:hypothetical protein